MPPLAELVINSAPGAAPPTTAVRLEAIVFHRTMPDYAATPLVSLPRIASELRVSRVMIKNEERRLGLPAYKVLGGAWALHEAIRRRCSLPTGTVIPFEELRVLAHAFGAITLTTATDGNHGRGIAAMAEHLGFACTVFVPADMIAERRDAIRSHGAQVEIVEGSYDDAVARAATEAKRDGWWLCADTVSDEHSAAATDFATDVQIGYSTLCQELVEQLGEFPDVMLVQAGVGALAASVTDFFVSRNARTRIVAVEPVASPCILRSIAANALTAVPDQHTSMAGLRAQQVSRVAWPTLHAHLSAVLTVTDAHAERAVRVLAEHGVTAGESGAASLAGALVFLNDAKARSALDITTGSTIAMINTEGATDATSYARIIAAPKEHVQ